MHKRALFALITPLTLALPTNASSSQSSNQEIYVFLGAPGAGKTALRSQFHK